LQRFVDGNFDVWLVETERGSVTRFTSDPADDAHPAWSPDGKYIVFASSRKGVGHFDLYRKPATAGLGTEEVLLQSPENKSWPHVSPDGHFVLYQSMDPKTMKFDIWALRLESDQIPFVVVGTEFDDRHARFSPDGKWIAYESDESGRFEIYIQPFPGPTSKFGPISTNGGAQVQWRGDGKELYYLGLDNRLMAVPIRLSSDRRTADFGSPVPLFMTRIFGGAVQANLQYTVSADGKRFLIHNVTDEATSPITVVLNPRLKP
jgi:Tol biopolymer transport system component